MLLTPNQLVMLADCLDAGFEACEVNHVEEGGTYSDTDLAKLIGFEAILRELARRGQVAEVKLALKGPASLADGGHDFITAAAIEYLTPVNDEDLPPVDR